MTQGLVAVTVALLGRSIPAFADSSPEDVARATALFQHGQQLIAANSIDAACEAFATSLQLDPKVGTRLNLADCRERQGNFVGAYALYEQAATEAERTGKEGRATFARQRLAALEPKLVVVTLRGADPAMTGLTIKLGGRELVRTEWSRPQHVEPGSVIVEVSAPGRTSGRIEQQGKAGAAIEIAIPVLGLAPVTVEPERVNPLQAPPVIAGPTTRWPFVVGGVGAGLLLGSVGLGLHAKSRYDDAVPSHDDVRIRSAQTEADLATGVAVLGGVAVVVGLVLVVHTRRTGDHVVIAPTSNGVGFLVGGTF